MDTQKKLNELFVHLGYAKKKHQDSAYQHAQLLINQGANNFKEFFRNICWSANTRFIKFMIDYKIDDYNDCLDTCGFSNNYSSEIISLLLQYGARKGLCSVFTSACLHNDVKNVQTIIQIAIKEDIMHVSFLYSGFKNACKKNKIDVVKYLLDEPYITVNKIYFEGLSIACLKSHFDVVKTIFEHPKIVNDIQSFLKDEIISSAVLSGNMPIIDYCLNIFTVNPHIYKPIIYEFAIRAACYSRRMNVIYYLLTKHNHVQSIRICLWVAANDNNLELFQPIATHFKDVDFDADNIFDRAHDKGSTKIAEYMLNTYKISPRIIHNILWSIVSIYNKHKLPDHKPDLEFLIMLYDYAHDKEPYEKLNCETTRILLDRGLNIDNNHTQTLKHDFVERRTRMRTILNDMRIYNYDVNISKLIESYMTYT